MGKQLTPYCERFQPVAVRYSLTSRGGELEPVLRGLADWVQRWEPERG